jgi:2-methylaconitate cis-trans-isomerase PrpF
MFHRRDLPENRGEWDAIFLSAMGSPDLNGRQLDGMGGGISSLSKVCILAGSTRPNVDIDYTFAQVSVKEARVDYSTNCGNMSSAVGPFAVDEQIISPRDGDTTVRIFNTNTEKTIHSTFEVRGGRALVEGELAIPGVTGKGAPIRLDFLEPAGASTGRLLPTGNPSDFLDVPGLGRVEASMIDAANACVFVSAETLGIAGIEMPEEIERNVELLSRLSAIRLQASVAMGISRSLEAAHRNVSLPFIGFVSPSQDARTLSGERVSASAADITVRMISNGQPHRAMPLTASICVAAASQVQSTMVHRALRPGVAETLRIAMPSGVLQVAAEVREEQGRWHVARGSLFRTARRLFEGYVYA